KALQVRQVQVVRLIRFNGVGVYFVTQSPADLSDVVLAQLGVRIQHGRRAFSVKEQKALRVVAEGFRRNHEFSTLDTLVDLGIGEALVGGLEAKGTPAMVQRVAIAPPQSRVGPLSESERHALIAASPLRGRYDQAIDRESAYEVLAQRAEEAVKEPAVEKPHIRRSEPAWAMTWVSLPVEPSKVRFVRPPANWDDSWREACWVRYWAVNDELRNM